MASVVEEVDLDADDAGEGVGIAADASSLTPAAAPLENAAAR